MVIPLIAAGIGAFGSYAAAKEQSRAQDKANAANMAGFNQYKPYVDAGLSGGQDAFNNAVNAGYYQGPTYAGPNAFQTNTVNTMGGYSPSVMNTGFNMMNTGADFGQNYQDLYNQTLCNVPLLISVLLSLAECHYWKEPLRGGLAAQVHNAEGEGFASTV